MGIGSGDQILGDRPCKNELCGPRHEHLLIFAIVDVDISARHAHPHISTRETAKNPGDGHGASSAPAGQSLAGASFPSANTNISRIQNLDKVNIAPI